MSEPEPDRISVVAAAIADGEPIDWALEHASVEPTDVNALEQLRIVAAIAQMHRESCDPLSAAPKDSEPRLAREVARPLDGDLFVWGSLRVVERIGGGSFGDVFRAFDTSLDREVALKLIRPRPADASRVSDSVVREGQMLARVRHPNVMAVYGAHQLEGQIGIWSEFLRGRTLADIVKQDGPLSAQEAVVAVDAICRALAAVHRAGLLHRDIKAQNVMREIGGRIVLMDFGLGRELNVPSANGLELAGTPLYLAPELFRGEPASPQSDIYSLGVLMFYLVTGAFPVTGGSMDEVRRNHAEGKRARLQDLRSDLPAVFVQVVERALSPDPAARFESAGELQAALGAVSHASPEPVTVATRAPRWRTAVASVLATAALCLAAFFGWERIQQPEPLEFTLTPPAGMAFTDGTHNVPAISPDGRQIAFVATNAQGISQLWMRSLSDRSAKPLPQTAGAVRPFWAPDGQSIGFFDPQGLRRISTSGAAAEFLVPASETAGGSWNRDGTLLLALDSFAGLVRMPATGGPPTQVTLVDRSRRESQHMWPQFLPDDRHFIFFVRSNYDDVQGVYLGTLDGGLPRRLVATEASGIYTNGSVLYLANGKLFTQPLDVRAGALSGEPTPLGLDVDATYESRLALSASDTGTLIYARPELKDMKRLVWYELRTGRELSVVAGPDKFRNPALSHDGRYLAVEWHGTGRGDLRVLDLVRGGWTRLDLPARAEGPVWAPDGRLAFAAAPDVYHDLYSTDLRDPSQTKLLVRSDREKEPTDWSADGRAIAYMVMERDRQGHANYDLWVATPDAQRNDPLLTSPTTEADARFSPDGRRFAYVANQSAVTDVYIRNIAGAAPPRKVSTAGGFDPVWRADDDLLYLNGTGSLCEVTIPSDERQPLGAPNCLFGSAVKTPGTSRNHYVLAPDKQRVLFASPVADAGTATFSVLVNWRRALLGR